MGGLQAVLTNKVFWIGVVVGVGAPYVYARARLSLASRHAGPAAPAATV